MISVRQAVGILHCDRTVVVVDKGYAVFAAGFDFPVEVIDHRAVAEIIAVDIGLLVSVPDYHERKRYLEWYAAKIKEG